MSEIWNAHNYQKKAVKWLIKHPASGLFLSPGLGKTSITLTAFQALQKAKAINKALVVAPLRPCELVWSEDGEIGKWDNFRNISYTLLHGNKKEQRLNETVDLYIINYEGLSWLIESGGINYLLKEKKVDLIVFDELSKMKHTKTKRFKQMKPYLGRFKRRWGLTGSPAANGLMDLFGQMYSLDLGQRLGKYITHYRHQYFYPGGYGGHTWTLQQGADKKIHSVIGDIMLSMKAEDYLDMPKLIKQNIWILLPPKAQKIYKQLEEDLIAIVNDDTILAVNKAVASGKCKQVASGGLYKDEISEDDELLTKKTRKTIHIHDAKTEALVDLVDELQGSPLLVGYWFQHDLERVKKALGDIPVIGGGTSNKEAARIVKDWNAGKIPILCGHPASMGHGLNLQKSGHHICWYSLTWNLEYYEQFIQRIYRQGSKSKRVFVYHILARDTIDEVVVNAISNKKRTQNHLMDALKKYCNKTRS